MVVDVVLYVLASFCEMFIVCSARIWANNVTCVGMNHAWYMICTSTFHKQANYEALK